MGDDRAAVYIEEDGLVVYRASAVGACDEALLGLRQGITGEDPPAWMLERFQEGTDWEEYIIDHAVNGEMLNLVSVQDEVEVEVMDGVVIRGHTDGRADDDEFPNQFIGLEAKKLGPDMFKVWERGDDAFFKQYPYYADQLTVYMHAMDDIPFIYAVGEWDRDSKRVIDVHTRLITEAPHDINDIIERVRSIEQRASEGEMPDCDGGRMWPCPLYFLHNEPEAEEVTDKKLMSLVSDYLYHKGIESEAKEAKDNAMKDIRAAMEDKGERVTIPGVANLTKYTNRSSRYDKEAAASDGVDLDKYKVVTERDGYVKITEMSEE